MRSDDLSMEMLLMMIVALSRGEGSVARLFSLISIASRFLNCWKDIKELFDKMNVSKDGTVSVNDLAEAWKVLFFVVVCCVGEYVR